MAAKAHELFKSSELEEKRRIIVMLFPNLEIDAGKLVFKPREPFDVFFNLPHRQEWLTVLNKMREEDYQEIMCMRYHLKSVQRQFGMPVDESM